MSSLQEVSTATNRALWAVALWAALQLDPAVGVAVVDREGRYRHLNARFAYLYARAGASDLLHRTLHELFPKAWADERLAMIAATIDEGTPRILRHIRRGVRLQTTIYPIRAFDIPDAEVTADDSGDDRVLLVSTELVDPEPRGEAFEVVECDVADLGELDVLSHRELEVLALLGQGLKTAEVAERLYRSPKTIDKHRESICQKLGVSTRAELIALARRAGLRAEHASVHRTHERV